MFRSPVPPHQQRAELKERLASGQLLRFPGAFSPLVATAIERASFEGVYISGAVLSADLALPDIGLTTLTEVTQRAQQIARVTSLPAIVDADTGFGEPMSAARTVTLIEQAGLAGLHLEDQVNPKRCGHLDHKEVVDTTTMTRRIGAAVNARADDNFLIIARTDSRAIEGVDAAIERCKAYVDAGADVIFPEALRNLGEFEAVRSAIDVPILANMTEFGKSDLFSTTQLSNIGVNIVIYPVTTLRLAMGTVVQSLERLRDDGDQRELVPEMQTRAELYELLNYERYNQFDSNIYNFSPGGTDES